MRLPGQLPLEQAQAQVVVQALVAELARLRALVQAAVLELAQVLRLEQALVQLQELGLGLQLERGPPVVWVPEPPLVRAQGREPARQQEPAVELEQAWKLRASRQQEQQQHRLQAAAQELPPYLPALPMKALC